MIPRTYAQLTEREVRELARRPDHLTHSTPGSFDDGMDYDVIEEEDEPEAEEDVDDE